MLSPEPLSICWLGGRLSLSLDLIGAVDRLASEPLGPTFHRLTQLWGPDVCCRPSFYLTLGDLPRFSDLHSRHIPD